MSLQSRIFKGPDGENLIRIPHKHLIFVREMIKHGDREHAYGKAYPDAKESSRKPSACRLYNRPEIKELIEEARGKAMSEAYNEWEQSCVDLTKAQLLELHEKRAACARIVRGQQSQTRYYKIKDQLKPVESIVDSPFAILRAIELDTKLEAEFFAKQPKENKHGKQKFAPGEFPYKTFIYNGREALEDSGDTLTKEEYDSLLKASLTDEDIKVPDGRLTPLQEAAGCYIRRDMETGKYETICPLGFYVEQCKKDGTLPPDFVINEEEPWENFNPQFIGEDVEAEQDENAENGEQTVNTDLTETVEDQHEEENPSCDLADHLNITDEHQKAA
jgi:hypothetical protein